MKIIEKIVEEEAKVRYDALAKAGKLEKIDSRERDDSHEGEG